MLCKGIRSSAEQILNSLFPVMGILWFAQPRCQNRRDLRSEEAAWLRPGAWTRSSSKGGGTYLCELTGLRSQPPFYFICLCFVCVVAALTIILPQFPSATTETLLSPLQLCSADAGGRGMFPPPIISKCLCKVLGCQLEMKGCDSPQRMRASASPKGKECRETAILIQKVEMQPWGEHCLSRPPHQQDLSQSRAHGSEVQQAAKCSDLPQPCRTCRSSGRGVT